MLRFVVCAAACAVAAPVGSALAQLENATFDAGFTGWSVQNTPGGVGAPGSVVTFDIDGDGPQGPGPAARFAVGNTGGFGGDPGGILLSQVVELEAGRAYTVGFDWAVQNTEMLANLVGGVFDLQINGQFLPGGHANAGAIGELSTVSGVVETTYVPAASGTHTLTIRIVRVFMVPVDAGGVPTLWQHVDNVRAAAVPSPGVSAAVLAAGGVCAVRRRRHGRVS